MKFLIVLVLSVSFLFSAVDINTASKKELTSLKGIGAKKADAIIAYRKKNCFKNVKELENVKGIGDKIVKGNMKELKAGPCKK